MSVTEKLKEDLISGIVFLVPVAVTLYIGYWIFNFIIELPVAERLSVTGVPVLDSLIQFLAAMFVLTVFLIGLGHLVRTVLSGYAHRWRDKIMNKIPGLRIIFRATKSAVETVSGKKTHFQKPVKVEVNGIRVTGFKTGETEDGRQLVFLPTSPNITTGFLLEMEEENIQTTDENVEEALTRILSIGIGGSEGETEELAENPDVPKRGEQ